MFRPLFAFNLDSNWPRDLPHIGRRQLLLRRCRLVCDAFAIQKCSRYLMKTLVPENKRGFQETNENLLAYSQAATSAR